MSVEFTADVLDYLQRSVLCWLATVDLDGAPNVSPKEVFVAHGANQVLVANIASPTSVRNILGHARVCLSVLEVFVQRGYKLRGDARIVRPGDAHYDQYLRPLQVMAGPRFPIHSVIVIDVDEIEPILAPSYRLVPGTTEESQRDSAMQAYGVRPSER